MRTRIFCVLLTALALICSGQAMADIWYVDSGAAPGGDGDTWGTAFQTIQEGINAAAPADEVWVKAGTYVLAAQIAVDEQVGLYGGFDGGEILREERDWVANVTIISGNLATRCLSVTVDGVILDGFTVTQGRTTVVGAGLQNNAAATVGTTIRNCIFDDNDTTLQGGAIDSRQGHMNISNCTFKNNDATTTQPRGGAIFLYAGTMALENCAFQNNTAGNGGALNLRNASGSVSITNCVFDGNQAYRSGTSSDGGVILSDRPLTMTGCTFVNNSANRYGGVIASYCPTGNAISFTNCLFANNRVGPNEGGNTPGGGAIAVNDGSGLSHGSLIITNCTFAGNTANGTGSTGGAIYNRIAYTSWTQFAITNSILWGDSPDEIYIPTGGVLPTVSYSDVQGGYMGAGNINEDPAFVGSGNYHLSAGSPCINTATDAGVYMDIDGDARPLLTGYDMGSDEFSGPCWDLDSDGYADEICGGNDCDDADADVHPGAVEVCNGIDDDCDSVVPADEADADADTYRICEGDCDDTRADVNPAAVEAAYGDPVCGDTLDNDCDGLTDAADPGCYQCTAPEQCDDSNPCTDDDCVAGACVFTNNTLPCDDGDACTVNDVCTDGVCVGSILDADADGYGSMACGGDDCDDANAAVHPGATEVCNGIDDDCDLAVDEANAQGCVTYYLDVDADTYGVAGDTQCLCEAAGEYTALQGGDCLDTDPAVNPGAVEECGQATCKDTLDNDCDGSADKADADCKQWCPAATQSSMLDRMAPSGPHPVSSVLFLLVPVGMIGLLRMFGRKR